MKLERLFGNLKHEHRESATDAIVSALIAQAGGSSVPPSVEALGAVEAAAGLWSSRAFASQRPWTPQTTTQRMSLTPSVHGRDRSRPGRAWRGCLCAGRQRRR